MTDYKHQISTAFFSDVLDKMGYRNQMLPHEIKPNFLDAKLFGIARPMTLKEITPAEDGSDIFKGLYFLETLNPGDVLVVANGFTDVAYFGELMATIAKKRGVDGVVIDGCTRDYVQLVKMGFPVFSKNTFARDLKGRGSIAGIDLSVKIGETVINPGDFLFGDYDGVVVVPQNIIDVVLKNCLDLASHESKVKADILNGMSVKVILNSRGDF